MITGIADRLAEWVDDFAQLTPDSARSGKQRACGDGHDAPALCPGRSLGNATCGVHMVIFDLIRPLIEVVMIGVSCRSRAAMTPGGISRHPAILPPLRCRRFCHMIYHHRANFSALQRWKYTPQRATFSRNLYLRSAARSRYLIGIRYRQIDDRLPVVPRPC